MLDYRKAKELMNAAVKKAWNEACLEVVGAEQHIRYDRLTYTDAPPTDAHWCRSSSQETDSPQSGFSAAIRGDIRRWTNFGTLFVQLFAPEKPSRFSVEQDVISRKVRQGLRKSRIRDENGCRITLNDIRILPLPSEKGMIRLNIIAAFNYSERN